VNSKKSHRSNVRANHCKLNSCVADSERGKTFPSRVEASRLWGVARSKLFVRERFSETIIALDIYDDKLRAC
jgi:hypothetical protein